MTSITSISLWYGRSRKRPKPAADPPIDEAKISRLLEEKERLIELEIAAERASYDIIHIVGQPISRPKIDRSLEKELSAALTMAERVEVIFRKKAIARAYWGAGDNERKWKWGGY